MELIKKTPKKKKIVVPSKATINLYTPANAIDPKKFVIVLVLVLLCLAAAAKFGIIDQLSKKTEAINKQSLAQSQLTLVKLKLNEYNEVEAKYGRYSYGWMTESEASLLQREQALDVIEKIIAPACKVENFSLSQNTLTLSVSGATLDEAREVVKTLKADARIQSAFVYSIVTSDESQKGKISMTVVFQRPVEQEG